MSLSIDPQIPFVWPEPRVTAGCANYSTALPFEAVARSASAIFGVISALDQHAVNWMEGYLSDSTDCMLRVVVSIHPTCRTSGKDVDDLLRLVERHKPKAAFKVFPEASLLDRSSNLLCFCCRDATAAIAMGPTENMGFAESSPSQANVVCQASAATLEACRRWFDYLWGISGSLRAEVATTMPQLILPEGDREAARLWKEYRARCLSSDSRRDPPVHVAVDSETGEVVLKDDHEQVIVSPTEEIGIPKLDALSHALAHVFELGALVAVDKASRIPPLEAPVKPEWFGVDSFRQTGMVRAQTSIKVAPFDDLTLRKIDRLRKVSGELLPRYSFALADGVRWIPMKAIPLFEAALTAANEDARKLLGEIVGTDLDSFLNAQHARIRADAQRMYEGYHPNGTIPESAVANILDELKGRLGKTRGGTLIPRVSYSQVAFNPGQSSEWSSPWGQAFHLLKGIAEFPREGMTNRFFWQGMRTDESQLIVAMDVAGDHLASEYGSRKAAQRAEQELTLVKRLDSCQADAREKCEALWRLIRTGDDIFVTRLLAPADGKGA